MRNLFVLALVFGMFSSTTMAQEALSLNEAKSRVMDENINLSIAYEQYVLAKSQARSKSLQLLPALSIDMLIYDYQYAMLRSIIPEPSRFFEAKAQKELAQAASVNRRIVQKNLLEDLETTYFLHQFHKEMATSFKEEQEITRDIAKRSQEAYDLGTIQFSDYYRIQRDVVKADNQSLNGTQLVKTEEFALKLMLQVANPQNEISLDRVDFYNETLDYPLTVEEATEIALKNSQELVQHDYLIAAAKKNKTATKLSWISWSGVGFDYFARVAISKHEIHKVELDKKKTQIEIRNQVAEQYALIEIQRNKINEQLKYLAMVEAEYEAAQEQETGVLNSYINTRKAELNVMYAQREAVRLKYELEVKFIKLKRLIGANMLTNTIPNLH